MSQHLSPQQIDAWVVGERSPEVEGHLRSCRACADEVARVTEPLSMFGAAIRSWGEEQMGPMRASRATSTARVRWWRFGLAFAMLLLLMATPVLRHRQVAVRTAAQDEMLLRQVEQLISQSVPAPMEPLAKLMPNDLSR